MSLLTAVLYPAPRSWAAETTSLAPYQMLKEKSETIASKNSLDGWAYVVSGGLALGFAIPAYYLSEDVFAQTIYSVGQTLGVAAVGYGSYLLLVEDDYTRFYRVIEKVPGLSESERNQIALGFLRENARRAHNVRMIRVITHGLTAGLNFLNAATSSNRELKTALFFLGGINTLAVLSFGLGRSEEEKFAESLPRAEIVVGAVNGISIRF